VKAYRNPFPTVDLILMDAEREGIFLIQRKNEPHGWALPGGFVDYGESLEDAARREGREETSLQIELLEQVGAYGDPGRDPRFHTVTVVYAAIGRGEAEARDDAGTIRFFRWSALPGEMAFDHRKILDDYRREGERP
jgi:8-oxo-dGTP diphosphatase